MPQEKSNNEANREDSQKQGQQQKAKPGAGDNAQGEKLHVALDEDVHAFGEPTDGSGGGGDQASTVP
jgi:hypothetical protein